MADELTVTVALSYLNGNVSLSYPSTTDKVTIAANFAKREILTVTLAGLAIPLGSIATPGYILIRNMDATNYIVVGNSGDTLPIRVNAGALALFQFAGGIVPYAIANTADVVIEYMLVSQ